MSGDDELIHAVELLVLRDGPRESIETPDGLLHMIFRIMNCSLL